MAGSRLLPAPEARSALGLMAKWPRPGAVKTRLQPPLDADAAARLYTAFVADLGRELDGAASASVLVIADRPPSPSPDLPDPSDRSELPSGWPPWPVVPQRGADLGQRLAAAFEDLGAGRRPIVLVGADHPDLPRAAVEAAFTALGAGADLVVGPTFDGGFYQVGLARPAPELFAKLPWSTPQLLGATLDRAAELGLSVASTRPWYDVDREQDLAFLIQHLRLERAPDPERLAATARVLADLEERGFVRTGDSAAAARGPAGS